MRSLSKFPDFAKLVRARYESMKEGELFVVDTHDLFETYLGAFPEGTNPIFRERTEHDCSCCKHFVRNIGNLVGFRDGRVVTVWDDFESAPAPYNEVGRILADRVRQSPVRTVWRTKERRYGIEQTNELLEGGEVRRWDHFAGTVDNRHFSENADQVRGDLNTTAQVLRRGLEELTVSAFETVIDLIDSGTLYKGEEFAPAIRAFQRLQQEYQATPDKEAFVWSRVGDRSARFRNTAIGTLLIDLSEGTDVEVAVRKYERVVAPTNYKRPTAIITPRMVEGAMTTLRELDLESAVERRHARIEDVSVNDVLFVNNDVAHRMKDGLTSLLMESAVTKKPNLDRAEKISAEEFFASVVPRSTSIEALVENRHSGNFMSLTAPVHENTGRLFKWDNDFSWSYDGEVADSIKQRVKAAGGNVKAKFRVSLAWFNTDDLDIHAHTPSGHISYANKMNVLDVDMNVFNPVKDPVENLSWTSVRDGTYKIIVNQYMQRNTQRDTTVGFTLEVECNGQLQQYSYDKIVHGAVTALVIEMRGGQIVDIKLGEGLTGGAFSMDKWGIKTETLVPVETLMLSPNHWNGRAVGNRHWFFLLRGVKNPDPVRGIYNEYLRPDLEQHRKVFEVLGSKTKAPFSENQLSGLGFSSTQRNTLTVVAKGPDFNRALEIQF